MSDINVQTFSGKVNVTNNLLVGSSHFFVDTVGNKVGITTASPDAGLHVNSNAYVNTDFRVGSSIIMNDTAGQITAGSFVGDGSAMTGINSDSGSWVNGTGNVYLSTTTDKVGIGTSDPPCLLTIDGGTGVNSTGGVLAIRQKGDTINDGITLTSSHANSTRLYKDGNGHFYIHSGGSDTVFENVTGNVGIGTTSPQQKLEVHGNILLGQNDIDSFIHGGRDIALSSDNDVLIVSDSNDTSGEGGADIIFGAGSAINTDTSRNFTFAQAYPSAEPRLEHMRIVGSNGRVGISKSSPDATLHVNGNAIIGDVGANPALTHTDAQLTLGGTHNTGYNSNNQIKLLITGGNNDGGSK